MGQKKIKSKLLNNLSKESRDVSEKVDRYRSLLDIGVALSKEKEVSEILELIVDKALETTEADAASLYLTEKIRLDSIGNKEKFLPVLRFHRSKNRVTGIDIPSSVLDLNKNSIAGFVALTGDVVKVDDCYSLDEDSPFSFQSEIDIETGYETISMLAVPLMNAEGKIRGVLQLINKLKPGLKSEITPKTVLTKEQILPFNDEDVELMEVFASQAAIALENAKLTEDIENLFESFIRASVTAIESRDPTTSGHSDRVAVLTVEFARAVHQCPSGPLKDIEFSEQQIRELRYAALLHDFGKIGVRESILQKELKLYPHEMETLLLRLESARVRKEMLEWKRFAQDLTQQIQKENDIEKLRNCQKTQKEVQTRIEHFCEQLQKIKINLIKANEPQIHEEDFKIGDLINWIHGASQELEQLLITPQEMVKLSLPRGTLGEEERKEIESHVTHTYHFLRQIAWTEDLSDVADIAHTHHEKCDGSGYPRGLTADRIPIQGKIMTIADIYDALTSMDRPYKRATTPERAVEILHMDSMAGKLDMDLLKIFIESGAFRSTQGMIRIRK